VEPEIVGPRKLKGQFGVFNRGATHDDARTARRAKFQPGAFSGLFRDPAR
jgi:hypothetical protein